MPPCTRRLPPPIRRPRPAFRGFAFAALLGAACSWGCDNPTGPAAVDHESPPATPTTLFVPAFPGAEGWGGAALNESRGLPLQVHSVTSTAATGPGTLFEAIENTTSDHYDIIIFRTGGVFDSVAPEGLYLNSSHVYIAGQTAPGDGVTIDGRVGVPLWIRGHGDNISDIVMRYIRIRGARTSMDISKGSLIVLDHMSFSWANRYLLAINRYPSGWSQPISDVSIQNSILSEVLAGHPTALVLGSHSSMKGPGPLGTSNISIHRNLFANNDRRNPKTAADNTLLANNVIYNWRLGAIQVGRRGTHDFLNNTGKHGPMSRSDTPYLVTPHCDHENPAFSMYASGNIGPASAEPDGDNWSGATRQVACYHNSGGAMAPRGAQVPSSWKRQPHNPQPWASFPFPVAILDTEVVFDAVLDDVGANARLACDGTWIPRLDDVDRHIIADTRHDRGPDEPLTAAPPWPDYDSGIPCHDTDGDGLPDAWEERYFGCRTCAEPGRRTWNGYLVIEHYLNGTTPQLEP